MSDESKPEPVPYKRKCEELLCDGTIIEEVDFVGSAAEQLMASNRCPTNSHDHQDSASWAFDAAKALWNEYMARYDEGENEDTDEDDKSPNQ